MESTRMRFAVLRIIAPALFAVGGICLVIFSALGAPSFWYVPCFYALPIIAGFWAWRPRVGAALGIGPLVSVVALLWYTSGWWLVCIVIFVILALACLVIAAKETGSSRTPLILSLCFLCVSLLADRLFTDKIQIRSYQARIALDGDAPWGAVEPEWSDDLKPIVLYRPLGDTYCYVAFKSVELRQRLSTKDGTTVAMQINIFKDFGTERGYNVRSVDGLLLANGKHVVRDAERFGGQILGASGTSSGQCW